MHGETRHERLGPVAVGQRWIRNSIDPQPIILSGLGLVEQPIRRAAQPAGRVGGARHEGLWLQGPQPIKHRPTNDQEKVGKQ